MKIKKPSKILLALSGLFHSIGEAFDPYHPRKDFEEYRGVLGDLRDDPVELMLRGDHVDSKAKAIAPDLETVVEGFWQTYGNSCGWKAVNGAPLPTWGVMVTQRPEVAAHWRKVAEYAISSLAETVHLNKDAVAPKTIKVTGARAANYEITDCEFSPEGDLSIKVRPAPVPRKEKPDTTTPEHPVVVAASESAQADTGE